MKKRLLLILALFIFSLLTGSVIAQDHGIGVGVIIGEPTGASAKLWTSQTGAFDFGLGVSMGGDRFTYAGNFTGGSRVHFHVDYLLHSFNVITASEKFPVYYGIGGRYNAGADYDASIGVRGVMGIAWLPRAFPVDVFFELVPVFQLTPSSSFGLDAGLGVRYFFK